MPCIYLLFSRACRHAHQLCFKYATFTGCLLLLLECLLLFPTWSLLFLGCLLVL